MRYEPREWFEDEFEYGRVRSRSRRDDYEDRRSRRSSERRHERAEDRTEDKRNDVTSSRTVPADDTKEGKLGNTRVQEGGAHNVFLS